MKRIGAHADGSIRQVAEHADGIFACNSGLAMGADGMAEVGTVKGIGVRFLYGDQQSPCCLVIAFDDTVQLITGMILCPKIGKCGIAHIPLGQINVKAVTLHQTTASSNGQNTAFHSGIEPIERRLGGEVIAPGCYGQPPGANGKAAFTVHVDDNEINGCTEHIPQDIMVFIRRWNTRNPMTAVTMHRIFGTSSPDAVEEDALDTQKYIVGWVRNCYDQAVRYGGINTSAVISCL